LAFTWRYLPALGRGLHALGWVSDIGPTVVAAAFQVARTSDKFIYVSLLPLVVRAVSVPADPIPIKEEDEPGVLKRDSHGFVVP
jgi:hypothetical protein